MDQELAFGEGKDNLWTCPCGYSTESKRGDVLRMEYPSCRLVRKAPCPECGKPLRLVQRKPVILENT